MTPVTVADEAWQEQPEGVLAAWFVSEGNAVEVGDLVAEVLIEKVQVEVVAPARGVIRLLMARDSIVRPGMALAMVDPDASTGPQ